MYFEFTLYDRAVEVTHEHVDARRYKCASVLVVDYHSSSSSSSNSSSSSLLSNAENNNAMGESAAISTLLRRRIRQRCEGHSTGLVTLLEQGDQWLNGLLVLAGRQDGGSRGSNTLVRIAE